MYKNVHNNAKISISIFRIFYFCVKIFFCSLNKLFRPRNAFGRFISNLCQMRNPREKKLCAIFFMFIELTCQSQVLVMLLLVVL